MDTDNKIYGTYPGFLKEKGVNKVINGTELELYFTINSIGGFIWRMNHDAAHSRIVLTEKMNEDLNEAQYAIEFAVLNTRRFGVEIPEPKDNEHVQRTEPYNKWFSWWNHYIQHKLTDEEYKELDKLMETGQDYSSFRPEGTWNC
jgi:hypothetical protein